jgi:acylphosphatase
MANQTTEMLARVTGQVQGVNFRAWAQSTAESLGLAGWVKNEHDGSVTALLSGPEPKVLAMVDAMWEGPAAAAVANVATEKPDHRENPEGFRIAD